MLFDRLPADSEVEEAHQLFGVGGEVGIRVVPLPHRHAVRDRRAHDSGHHRNVEVAELPVLLSLPEDVLDRGFRCPERECRDKRCAVRRCGIERDLDNGGVQGRVGDGVCRRPVTNARSWAEALASAAMRGFMKRFVRVKAVQNTSPISGRVGPGSRRTSLPRRDRSPGRPRQLPGGQGAA